jgi:hypothetical protein
MPGGAAFLRQLRTGPPLHRLHLPVLRAPVELPPQCLELVGERVGRPARECATRQGVATHSHRG